VRILLKETGDKIGLFAVNNVSIFYGIIST
jgi:hypothetical protein